MLKAESSQRTSRAQTGRDGIVSFVKELRAAGLSLPALYEQLALDGKPAFLLEQSRYASLFFNPREILTIDHGALFVERAGRKQRLRGNPLQALRAHLERFQVLEPERLPPFACGAVGYLGYDCVQYLERIALPPAEAGREDEACFVIFKQAIVHDRVAGKLYLVANLFPGEKGKVARALEAMEALAREAMGTSQAIVRDPTEVKETVEHPIEEGTFHRAIGRIKEHIKRGDIFQCVLADRTEVPLEARAFEVYRALRQESPAPYNYFFETGKGALLGASPEMLVKVEKRQVETCPIAGTRPRGTTPDEDRKRERQLCRSEKERAEHLMLVDLSRNDLGRVCSPGSVRVRDFMQVERFSHVMHLVSHVVGELESGRTPLEALFACFPAGTLTGAPKIRAMEIIAELEKRRRGAYGGAVVLYDFRGMLDSCIAIRSLFAKGGVAAVQAGAGVVADSRAAREAAEIQHKTRAVRKAIARAKAAGNGGRR